MQFFVLTNSSFCGLGADYSNGRCYDNADFAGESVVSLVHYGHGVSFSQLTVDPDSTENTVLSDDPELLIADVNLDQVITPWFQGAVTYKQRAYTLSQNTNHVDDWE